MMWWIRLLRISATVMIAIVSNLLRLYQRDLRVKKLRLNKEPADSRTGIGEELSRGRENCKIKKVITSRGRRKSIKDLPRK